MGCWHYMWLLSSMMCVEKWTYEGEIAHCFYLPRCPIYATYYFERLFFIFLPPKIRINIFFSWLHLYSFFFPFTFSLYIICTMTSTLAYYFVLFCKWGGYIAQLLVDQEYDLAVMGIDYMRLGRFSNIWKSFSYKYLDKF